MFCKHLLLQSACFILIMHSLVPHEHHTESLEEEHVCQQAQVLSFLDIFRIAFHSDIGEGHLDYFIAADNATIQGEFALVTDGHNHSCLDDIFVICALPIQRISAAEKDAFDKLPFDILDHYFLFDFRRGPPILNDIPHIT